MQIEAPEGIGDKALWQQKGWQVHADNLGRITVRLGE